MSTHYLTRILDQAREWRREAALYRRRGAAERADMVESFADDLEERVAALEGEPLSLEDAAEESGLSYSAIQKKVASGALPNAGRKGAPRVRRGDLPRLAQHATDGPRLVTDGPDLADEVTLARRGGDE